MMVFCVKTVKHSLDNFRKLVCECNLFTHFVVVLDNFEFWHFKLMVLCYRWLLIGKIVFLILVYSADCLICDHSVSCIFTLSHVVLCIFGVKHYQDFW